MSVLKNVGYYKERYKMIGNTYGIDFGSLNIQLYAHKESSFREMKNAIAIKNKKNVLAVGDTAYEMYERESADIEVVYPMKEGVISHFHDMQLVLKDALKETKNRIIGSKYIIAVPTDVTEVEKKAFYDLLKGSITNLRSVTVVERCIADAVGLDIDVKNEAGALIVNFGAETTEVSIIATGGMIINKLIKKGGRHIEQNLQGFLKQNQDFYIGEGWARKLRTSFGIDGDKELWGMKVSGRNMITGIPEQRVICREDIEFCAYEILDDIVIQIKGLLERTPPLILKNIQTNGLYICGGVANTSGIKEYLEKALSLKVHRDNNGELTTIKGISKIIDSKELNQMSYSMANENYRWKR